MLNPANSSGEKTSDTPSNSSRPNSSTHSQGISAPTGSNETSNLDERRENGNISGRTRARSGNVADMLNLGAIGPARNQMDPQVRQDEVINHGPQLYEESGIRAEVEMAQTFEQLHALLRVNVRPRQISRSDMGNMIDVFIGDANANGRTSRSSRPSTTNQGNPDDPSNRRGRRRRTSRSTRAVDGTEEAAGTNTSSRTSVAHDFHIIGRNELSNRMSQSNIANEPGRVRRPHTRNEPNPVSRLRRTQSEIEPNTTSRTRRSYTTNEPSRENRNSNIIPDYILRTHRSNGADRFYAAYCRNGPVRRLRIEDPTELELLGRVFGSMRLTRRERTTNPTDVNFLNEAYRRHGLEGTNVFNRFMPVTRPLGIERAHYSFNMGRASFFNHSGPLALAVSELWRKIYWYHCLSCTMFLFIFLRIREFVRNRDLSNLKIKNDDDEDKGLSKEDDRNNDTGRRYNNYYTGTRGNDNNDDQPPSQNSGTNNSGAPAQNSNDNNSPSTAQNNSGASTESNNRTNSAASSAIPNQRNSRANTATSTQSNSRPISSASGQAHSPTVPVTPVRSNTPTVPGAPIRTNNPTIFMASFQNNNFPNSAPPTRNNNLISIVDYVRNSTISPSPLSNTHTYSTSPAQDNNHTNSTASSRHINRTNSAVSAHNISGVFVPSIRNNENDVTRAFLRSLNSNNGNNINRLNSNSTTNASPLPRRNGSTVVNSGRVEDAFVSALRRHFPNNDVMTVNIEPAPAFDILSEIQGFEAERVRLSVADRIAGRRYGSILFDDDNSDVDYQDTAAQFNQILDMSASELSSLLSHPNTQIHARVNVTNTVNSVDFIDRILPSDNNLTQPPANNTSLTGESIRELKIQTNMSFVPTISSIAADANNNYPPLSYTPEAWSNQLNCFSVSRCEMNSMIMNYLVVKGHHDVAACFAQEANIQPIETPNESNKTSTKAFETALRSQSLLSSRNNSRNHSSFGEFIAHSGVPIHMSNSETLASNNMNPVTGDEAESNSTNELNEEPRQESTTSVSQSQSPVSSKALDFEKIRNRKSILTLILQGKYLEAIKKIEQAEPTLLESNRMLQFSLLKAQLIEMIRDANIRRLADEPEENSSGTVFPQVFVEMIEPVADFARAHLLPLAQVEPKCKEDLEITMALLCFPPDTTVKKLRELMDFKRRHELANEVNNAMLGVNGISGESKIHSLVRLWGWAENELSKKEKVKIPLLNPVELDF